MKNQIKSLQRPDRSVTEDNTEMEEMATNFYCTLYTSEGVTDIDQVLNTPSIPLYKATNLNYRYLGKI